MPRPLRDRDPDNYHLVTVRTEEARIWMVPTERLSLIVGGILARYQQLLSITIYAFSVLGNHIHLLLDAPEQNLDIFMENVLREIARRVNIHNRRRGHLWSRRYDDQVILTDSDLLQAYLYVTTNSVKHGLVRDVRQWPGLSSYPQVVDEKPRRYPFVHYSKEDTTGKPLISYHDLTITPLPENALLSFNQRREKMVKLIQDYQQALIAERLGKGLGFMGRKAVLRQIAGREPITVSRSPRPICYTRDLMVRRMYRAERSLFRQRYCEASEAFRSGKLDTEFPSYCFKPPIHRGLERRLPA